MKRAYYKIEIDAEAGHELIRANNMKPFGSIEEAETKARNEIASHINHSPENIRLIRSPRVQFGDSINYKVFIAWFEVGKVRITES